MLIISMENNIEHIGFLDKVVPRYIRENFVLINDSEENWRKEDIEMVKAYYNINYPDVKPLEFKEIVKE